LKALPAILVKTEHSHKNGEKREFERCTNSISIKDNVFMILDEVPKCEAGLGCGTAPG